MNATTLHARFEAERRKAVELTDTYRGIAADDPRKTVIWTDAMQHTDAARQLLESWLAAERQAENRAHHT